MQKYTTEMAEESEIQSMLDALCDGCIELNDEFLDRFTHERVAAVLKSVQESDRAFHLDGNIIEDACHFNGTPVGTNEDDIWLDIAEIEVQFEGEPEDYFEDVSDWYIPEGGNLAYLYVGYGLTVTVDIDGLKEDIDECYAA